MVAASALTVFAFVLVASLGLVACGQGGSDTTELTTQVTGGSTTDTTDATVTSTTDSGSEQTTFTLDELAQFDGKDGRSAYVAVDGVVYDVTGSRMWPEGGHARCDLGAAAGQDLSELINKAPANMRGLLSRMPVVGRLAPQ
jgi:predicted heme/steroid binding protein